MPRVVVYTGNPKDILSALVIDYDAPVEQLRKRCSCAEAPKWFGKSHFERAAHRLLKRLRGSAFVVRYSGSDREVLYEALPDWSPRMHVRRPLALFFIARGDRKTVCVCKNAALITYGYPQPFELGFAEMGYTYYSLRAHIESVRLLASLAGVEAGKARICSYSVDVYGRLNVRIDDGLGLIELHVLSNGKVVKSYVDPVRRDCDEEMEFNKDTWQTLLEVWRVGNAL